MTLSHESCTCCWYRWQHRLEVSFLLMFGTLALLWRVLHYVGYYEPSRYYWNEVYLEGQPWYEVRLTILARTQAPFWQEWKAESDGRTP